MYAEYSCLELLPNVVENIPQLAKEIKTSGAEQEIKQISAMPF